LANVNWLINVLKVAFGLGFVIFLHELGHFLLAKWNGVKVEKFSIGFGPTLLGFTKGDTEYVLAAVPLGGFVKMLGEGPDEPTSKSSDPRAYPNKSVSARMAIISAGVIMNLILGLACFVYAYGQGMEETPAMVGSVIPGAPAYLAGVRPGDEIVSLDGRTELSFSRLQLKVRLSGRGQAIHFELKRPGREALIPLDLEPRRDETAEYPGIGIAPSLGLSLAPIPFLPPAGLKEPVKEKWAGFRPGDRVIALGPAGGAAESVGDIQAFYRAVSRLRDDPVEMTVERSAKSGPTAQAGKPERLTRTLPPDRFVDFGARLEVQPVAAVRGGSPAERAGFKKGDLIVRVNGRDDFDPMRLPTECYDSAGKPMTFEVQRPEEGAAPRALTLTVTPDDSPPWTDMTPWTALALRNLPLDVPGIGLAYHVRTKVVAVAPGSPAARAGLKPGDVINGMTLPPADGEKAPVKLTFDEKEPGWASAFQLLQLRPPGPVTFRVNNSSANLSITPEPADQWFYPLRGLQFQYLTREVPPLGVTAALRRGWDDTVDNILSIYATFRSLAQSRVSPKNLGGPIMIATVAYEAAGLGLTDLVRFLGILSINLAVLNFLPIPPLDGGQMVFLLAEKVRGRPLPDSALIAGTYVGLFLVLGLMAFVIFQDVSRLVTGG
jgi:regulator of sigma E protease